MDENLCHGHRGKKPDIKLPRATSDVMTKPPILRQLGELHNRSKTSQMANSPHVSQPTRSKSNPRGNMIKLRKGLQQSLSQSNLQFKNLSSAFPSSVG